jgi:hypothetical protein
MVAAISYNNKIVPTHCTIHPTKIFLLYVFVKTLWPLLLFCQCLDLQFWNTVKSIKYFEILKICIKNPLEFYVKNSDCKKSFKKNLFKSHKINKILQNLLKSSRHSFFKIVFQNLNPIHPLNLNYFQ